MVLPAQMARIRRCDPPRRVQAGDRIGRAQPPASPRAAAGSWRRPWASVRPPMTAAIATAPAAPRAAAGSWRRPWTSARPPMTAAIATATRARRRSSVDGGGDLSVARDRAQRRPRGTRRSRLESACARCSARPHPTFRSREVDGHGGRSVLLLRITFPVASAGELVDERGSRAPREHALCDAFVTSRRTRVFRGR
jgi:hypothetical protein